MTRNPHVQDDILVLSGLDGSNPLAFLAALGTLRTLTLASPDRDVKMCWIDHSGAWRPAIVGGGADHSEFLDQLESALAVTTDEPFRIDDKLPFPSEQFAMAGHAAQRTATPRNRQVADFLVAFGCAACVDDKGMFKDTLLRMVRSGDSAGQGLPAYVLRIRNETRRADLERTLYQRWTCQDDRCGLRWDPIEDCRYALQWTDPSKQGTRSMRGANRLAIEAMPFLFTVPAANDVCTIGFSRFENGGTYWTWPIWHCPSSLQCIQSLLSRSEFQREVPPSEVLRAIGIAEVYRCERVSTSKYYRNFTPARAV